VQSRQVSDHCALIVKIELWIGVQNPFKLLMSGCRYKGLKEVMKNSWQAPISRGNSMEYLKEKLKRTKKILKHWNKEVFSSFMKRKQELLAEIEELDAMTMKGLSKKIYELKGWIY